MNEISRARFHTYTPRCPLFPVGRKYAKDTRARVDVSGCTQTGLRFYPPTPSPDRSGQSNFMICIHLARISRATDLPLGAGLVAARGALPAALALFFPLFFFSPFARLASALSKKIKKKRESDFLKFDNRKGISL